MIYKWILVHVDSIRLQKSLMRFFGDFTFIHFPDQDFDIKAQFVDFSARPEYGPYFKYGQINIYYSLLEEKEVWIDNDRSKIIIPNPLKELSCVFEIIDYKPEQSIITQSYSEFSPPFYASEIELRILVEIKAKVLENTTNLWKVDVLDGKAYEFNREEDSQENDDFGDLTTNFENVEIPNKLPWDEYGIVHWNGGESARKVCEGILRHKLGRVGVKRFYNRKYEWTKIEGLRVRNGRKSFKEK